MTEAFICDAIRTPIGRYGGGLANIRADDLGAVPIRELTARNPGLDPKAIEEVFYGCANDLPPSDWSKTFVGAVRLIATRLRLAHKGQNYKT